MGKNQETDLPIFPYSLHKGVGKYWYCHKANVVITGRENCFHDCVYVSMTFEHSPS